MGLTIHKGCEDSYFQMKNIGIVYQNIFTIEASKILYRKPNANMDEIHGQRCCDSSSFSHHFDSEKENGIRTCGVTWSREKKCDILIQYETVNYTRRQRKEARNTMRSLVND